MEEIKKKSTVYELRLSAAAFELILSAIHSLSLKNRRFETLASVISAGSQADHESLTKAISDFHAIRPVEGDIKVYVRLSTDRHREFEAFRLMLNESGATHLGVRDAVLICTLLTAPRK